MAVQQQQVLPPQYVEDLQKDYGTQLTAATAAPLDPVQTPVSYTHLTLPTIYSV